MERGCGPKNFSRGSAPSARNMEHDQSPRASFAHGGNIEFLFFNLNWRLRIEVVKNRPITLLFYILKL